MKRPMGRTAWLVPTLIALVFFIMSVAMAEGMPVQGFNGKVTLDVNPSVELNIENGIVTGIFAYNEEGQLILENASMEGLSAEASLQAVLAQLAAGGYLSPEDSEPYLLITTLGSGQNDDFTKDLEDTAKDYMDGLGTEYKVRSASLRDDVATKAAALGVSAGRYVMMQSIAQTQGITIEEAIAQFGGASVKTLMEAFEGLEDAVKGDDDDLESDDEDEEDEDVGDDKDDELDDEDEDKDDEEDDEEKSEEELLKEKQQREEAKRQREEERRLEEQKREEAKRQREEERRLEEQKRNEEKRQREQERGNNGNGKN